EADIGELNDAIDQIGVEMAAHRRELGDMPRRRAEVLFADNAVEANRRISDREAILHAALEVGQAQIERLQAKREERKDALRVDRIEHHRRAVRTAFDALAPAYLNFVEANEAALRVFADAATELGGNDAQRLVANPSFPGGIGTRETMLHWRET